MDFTVNREYKCFPTSSFLNIEVALLNKHIECTNGDKSNKLRCLKNDVKSKTIYHCFLHCGMHSQNEKDEIMNSPTDNAILETAKERIIVNNSEVSRVRPKRRNKLE
ncbi:4033_t:CDS:2 [Entrophospora sp. SA101]|nr:4033_t:CDS:2 [Entrophospora sp. SA101]